MTYLTPWQTVERQPGYFGKNRAIRFQEYDTRYGTSNWRLAWEIGDYTEDTALDFLGMTTLYEESYFAYFQAHPEVYKELIRTAADVYDDAPSNLASRFDYTHQETERTHVQDIAIRRCVLRRGDYFHGAELIQIRLKISKHPLSQALHPGVIPFLFPEKICAPQLTGWWQPDSVESFYQSNKVIQRRT